MDFEAEKVWSRYGVSEDVWSSLTKEQRVLRYERWRKQHTKCDHPARLEDWPKDLQEAYSYDPYSHTAHMDPCKRWGIPPPQRDSIPCHCQMCTQKIGIPR